VSSYINTFKHSSLPMSHLIFIDDRIDVQLPTLTHAITYKFTETPQRDKQLTYPIVCSCITSSF